MEEGGDPRQLEVECGTANVWYNTVKLASGVTSPPEGATAEKSGWVHLSTLARQIGRTTAAERAAETTPRQMHALSWNVGGQTAAKALEVLLALSRGGIHPFHQSLVVLFQEIICDEGKFHLELEELQLIFGKGPGEWRGNAVAHTSNLRHTRGKICPVRVTAVRERKMPPWTSRRITSTSKVVYELDQHATLQGDPVHLIQTVAVAITDAGERRRQLWKDARKQHQREHRQWKQRAMQLVAEQDWSTKRALTELRRDHSWELGLTDSSNCVEEGSHYR
ncbi:kif1 [Symbiodinium sp. CCMP2456]|nr:kif1 [Symbiodinium sp. CCMP2456]